MSLRKGTPQAGVGYIIVSVVDTAAQLGTSVAGAGPLWIGLHPGSAGKSKVDIPSVHGCRRRQEKRTHIVLRQFLSREEAVRTHSFPHPSGW